MPDQEPYRRLLDMLDELTQARVEFAREFQLAKVRIPGITDGHAREVAIEVTGDRVTRAQAIYDINLILFKEMHPC